jgi:DNA-binding NarL/FixJ family response regulator
LRHPQVVIYEKKPMLAEMIEPLAKENAWLIRESRQPGGCLNLLRQVRPSVLVLKLGELIEELELLGQIHHHVPDCAVIVVSDVKLEGNEQRLNLAGIAYDLGASYVMFPPITQTLIEDLVSGLMAATISRSIGDDDET